MKIVTVIGARPQFVKAAMVSRAIAAFNARAQCAIINEEIIHTGQHFDTNMSRVFFEEMGIPKPRLNLEIHGGMHGDMTGRMLRLLEPAFIEAKADLVLVYGDTNSTLAGALAAAKLNIPIAHVEAGLRSFNRRMPEEINRVVTDHLSSLLFCPTKAAVANLKNEGITAGLQQVGDVMYDAALVFGKIADGAPSILDRLSVKRKGFFLATVHRAENTDSVTKLANILDGLGRIARDCPVVFPVHPRTRERLNGLSSLADGIILLDPVSFMEMIQLERAARGIITDSGGVQKEAYFHGVPCVTVRAETEWVETVESGWNTLVGDNPVHIHAASLATRQTTSIAEYGDGKSAEKIVEALRANFSADESSEASR